MLARLCVWVDLNFGDILSACIAEICTLPKLLDMMASMLAFLFAVVQVFP